jgi:hypothetical protein
VPPNSQQEIKELQCHCLGKQLYLLLGILGKKKKVIKGDCELSPL